VSTATPATTTTTAAAATAATTTTAATTGESCAGNDGISSSSSGSSNSKPRDTGRHAGSGIDSDNNKINNITGCTQTQKLRLPLPAALLHEYALRRRDVLVKDSKR
jgi:type IV secretory pathway TrbL component